MPSASSGCIACVDEALPVAERAATPYEGWSDEYTRQHHRHDTHTLTHTLREGAHICHCTPCYRRWHQCQCNDHRCPSLPATASHRYSYHNAQTFTRKHTRTHKNTKTTNTHTHTHTTPGIHAQPHKDTPAGLRLGGRVRRRCRSASWRWGRPCLKLCSKRGAPDGMLV
jgi:hypothetical protein